MFLKTIILAMVAALASAQCGCAPKAPLYRVALDNNGPEPVKTGPICLSPASAPAIVKPTVSLPAVIPAPKVVSASASCVKTVLKPQLYQQLVSVPIISKYLQTVTKPVLEVITFNAVPTSSSYPSASSSSVGYATYASSSATPLCYSASQPTPAVSACLAPAPVSVAPACAPAPTCLPTVSSPACSAPASYSYPVQAPACLPTVSSPACSAPASCSYPVQAPACLPTVSSPACSAPASYNYPVQAPACLPSPTPAPVYLQAPAPCAYDSAPASCGCC